ncbi:MAG: hypothetical protein IJU95_06445, partial [Treponema sp.]|nr:hypothetical protein [Treponema sp.]
MGKMPNLAGLYDMSGNVGEMSFLTSSTFECGVGGGSYIDNRVVFASGATSVRKYGRLRRIGFRVVRAAYRRERLLADEAA